MAKETKKRKRRLNRRLKRTVMGTLSAVFMLSAVIVALIPVPEAKAANTLEDAILNNTPDAVADPDLYIPKYVENNYPVFASGDGNFRVAYGSNGGTMTGVIVYYNINNVVTNATLTIPSHIEAFLYHKPSETYIAVNKDREYLYYISQEASDPIYNEDGTLQSPAKNRILSPCTAETQSTWAGMPLYVVAGGTGGENFELVSGNSISYTQSTQLVVDVQYIGSERYEVDLNLLNSGTVDGTYAYTGTPSAEKQGVFEGATNFGTLVVPDKILAIGNNAFRGCQMQSVKIENGVNSIGNHAFENCNQLTTIQMVEPSNLKEIGAYAFAGCTYLSAVKVPDTVKLLGNCCFKDCTNMSAVNIDGVNQDGNTSLTTVGSGLFYNCYSLTQIVFPDRVNNIDKVEFLCYGCSSMTYLGLPNNAGSGDHVFKYNNVTACNSLDTVEVSSRDLKLDCKDSELIGSGFDDIYTGAARDIFGKENLGENSAFQESYEVSPSFCIMAYSQSYAHSYAQKHNESFGYLDDGYVGWFEKMVDGYAFRVTEDNVLVDFEKVDETSDGRNVIIPDNIAKYHVSSIASDTFSGNTDIVYLYIPESVQSISPGAFKGCTNLRTVNFDNALSVQEIGQGAFKTGVSLADIDSDGDQIPDESLCFIGDISSSSVPFQYAMDVSNSYNGTNAPTQFITYASKFPQNLQIQLTVQKNPNTNEIESAQPVVVKVPTEEQLKGNESYSLSTYDGTSEYVRTKTQENEIVASAYNKYLSNLTSPVPIELTEEEQGVIDAVYHVHIPDGVRGIKDDLFLNNTAVKSVILDTVESVPDHAFEGCSSMTTFEMRTSGAADGETLGERAFQNCTALEDVTLPATLSTITSMPFAGCTALTDVYFSDSTDFICQDGIIKGLDENGSLGRVVECLETRGTLVGPAKLSAADFSGVTTIDPCAFQNCTGVREAYLDDSQIAIVPDYCFDGATSLYYCSLPDTTKKIGKYAFRNTALSTAVIPGSVQSIDDTAFITEDDAGNQNYIQGLTVECEEDSTAYWYCTDKDGITAQTYAVYYTVTFLDWDEYELKTEKVRKGASATAPRAYREGYALTGWTKDFTNVKEDITTQAIYTENNAPTIDGYYSVVFQDFDGLYTWDTQYLKEGDYPRTPAVTPSRTGKLFSYWSPSNYTSIAVTGNLVIQAYYIDDPDYDPDNDSGNSSGSDSTTDNNTKKQYTVNFVDYDGSVLDSQVVTEGNCPVETTVVPTRKGYTFTAWSPSNYASVPVTSNITVTALYKKGTASDDNEDHSGQTSSDASKGDSSSGTSDSGQNTTNNTTNNTNTSGGNHKTTGSNTNKNTTSGTNATANKNTGVSANTISRNPSVTTQQGTKVVVTKSGISNRDLVSAKVSGSNDNFVVKISDSEEARSAVEQALLTEYGSLDNLKYFAMDISLYDSTGTTKIQDTTGITVTVTMPIPDALAGYAGNNKAGAVKNGAFEKLSSRLITIDHVPCISFDATHFSPYTIYVETDHLTSGVTDATPTTGDPIHPKWFLSIGLALLSILLFFGKGSKNKIVKVIE